MKKFVCIFLCFLVLMCSPCTIFADNKNPWEEEYGRIISNTKLTADTRFVLADIDNDDFPELFCCSTGLVSFYAYKNSSLIKIEDNSSVPPIFIENMKLAVNTDTQKTAFLGQAVIKNKLISYRLSFSDSGFSAEILGSLDVSGKENSKLTEEIPSAFLPYEITPFNLCMLTKSEILSVPQKTTALSSFFSRYDFLSSLSDDTSDFSTQQREAIKKMVGGGKFLAFDKISVLGASNLFVSYFVVDSSSLTHFPYKKMFACISLTDKSFKPVIFSHESEINTELLFGLKSTEYEASNITIDYNKTASFRGFDDYVNYLSSILSASGKNANSNGKKDISEYIEFAVNKSSKGNIKAINNVVTVDDYSVSYIADYAVNCMERLLSLCRSDNIVQIRTPRTTPELIITGADLSKPIRIEFENGLSRSLSKISGLKLTLGDSRGIYITPSDLSVLEGSADMFCIELTLKDNGFSVVFADRNNNIISATKAPVWFFLPAKSIYSTVFASLSDSTENWGGQYHAQNKAIEFSTTLPGYYEVVENDLTINDISQLPKKTQEAIRFLVSKDILSVDKYNNFNPDRQISKYDFTIALVKMFYSVNPDAVTSFSDINENSEYYPFVASAEAQNVAVAENGLLFSGKKAVSKEYMVAISARTLAKIGGYTYPETFENLNIFSDGDNISEWAKADISLALDHGLAEKTDSFLPDNKVNKAEIAEILYDTYMKLYEVSPVTTVSSPAKSEDLSPEISAFDKEFKLAMSILGLLSVLFAGYIIRKIIKRAKKKQKK